MGNIAFVQDAIPSPPHIANEVWDMRLKMEGWKSRFWTYEKRAILLLSIAFGLVGLDRWIIAPLAPAIISDLGVSPATINFLIASLGVTWGISAALMGGLSDRFGRRRVLIPAILLFSAASGLSGAASSIGLLFAARAFMGVAEGAFCPASFAATADASQPHRRGFNQGLQQSMFALFGLGIGPILATWLLQYMSWRGTFMLVALPGFIVGVLLWLTIREPSELETLSPERNISECSEVSVRAVLAVRNVQIAMVGLLCAMCGIFVLSANVPLYLSQTLGLSPMQVGVVSSAIGWGGFLGQWILSWASDHFGRRTMAVSGFSGGAVFLVLFIEAGSHPVLLFLALFGGAICSFGLLSLLTGPVATEAAPTGMISTAAGLIIGAGEIFGGGLALVVAGYVIATFGIAKMLYLALGGLVCGAIISLFLRETAPRKRGAVGE